MKVWRCPDCDQRVARSDMLSARNPFNNDPEAPPVTGCPHCLACNPEWIEICDEPGCENQTTCGTPTKAGYRRTCSNHAMNLKVFRPAEHRDGASQ